MKYTLILLFALNLACSTPKKELKKEPKPIEKEIVVEKIIDKPKVKENELIKKENTLVNIRKTPCFGDCAVYSVAIDKSGYVTFKGDEYVLKKGTHEFKLSDEEFKKLNDMFDSSDFSKFKTVYDNTKISDLPSTFIIHNNKQVKIRLWKDIPDELINIHEFIEGILLDKNLIE